MAETGQKSDGSNSDFSGWSKNSLNDSTIIRKVIDNKNEGLIVYFWL